MARRPALASLALVAVLGAACADDRPDASGGNAAAAPTTVDRTTIARATTTLGDLVPSQGFVASIRQYREDDLTGVVQLQLWRGGVGSSGPTGVGDDTVTVRSVQLHWPGLADVPATAISRVMVPGQRLDFPTPGGEVVCPGSEPFRAPSFAQGTVTVTGDGPDGPFRVDAPLIEDAQTTLDRIYERDCVAQAVSREVAVELVGPWVRADRDVPVAVAALRVTRRSATGPVRVDAVNGSVLLTLTSPVALGTATAELPAATTSIDLPLEVLGSGRCDGHALGESKKTFQFQVTLRLGTDGAAGSDRTTAQPAATGLTAQPAATGLTAQPAATGLTAQPAATGLPGRSASR